MAMQKLQVGAVLAVAMTVIAVSVLASSLLMSSQTIPNTGNVIAVGVGVYWDSSCTNNVTNIDWGIMEPGSSVKFTVFIKSEGTEAVKLNVTTANWSPPIASSEIFLTWNRENYVLDSGLVVETLLTLSVSSDISGISSFNFDIVITGTEFA
jgi:hypothetical protein